MSFAGPDNALALCASSLSLSLCSARPDLGRHQVGRPSAQSRPANTLKPFQNMKLADITPPGDRAQEFDAQTLSKVLSAYATLGVMPERLAAASAAELMHRLPDERVLPEDLVGLLWSLCLLQVCWRVAAGATDALIGGIPSICSLQGRCVILLWSPCVFGVQTGGDWGR